MSLKSLLRTNSPVKQVLKEISPSKRSFASNTGFPAFSKDNPMLVPYAFDNNIGPPFVGTACDYLFRFIIARRLNTNKEAVLDGLAAEKGLNDLEDKMQTPMVINARKIYDAGKIDIRRYIYGEEISMDRLAYITFRMAYLENYYRSGQLPLRQDDVVERNDPQITNDIISLGILFEKTFIDSGIVQPDSDVVFNPIFGKWSALCGGADADVYIDGILYDFKCSKTLYDDWTEIGQVYGYFMLNKLCQSEAEPDKYFSLQNKTLHSIAIYKARHGLINKCVISESDADSSPQAVALLRDALEKDTLEPNNALVKKPEWLSREQQVHFVATTDIYNRDIPIESFVYEVGTLTENEFAGRGVIQATYESQKGNRVVWVNEKNVKYDLSFSEFFANFKLVFPDKEAKENCHILHKKKGYGKVLQVINHTNYSELVVDFQYKGEVTINKDSTDYCVAKTMIPQFRSVDDFPFAIGEKAIWGSDILSVIGFSEENGKTKVILGDTQGNTHKVSSSHAWIHLGDEKLRDKIVLMDEATGKRVNVDETIRVGSTLLYHNTQIARRPVHLRGTVISVGKDEKGVNQVTVDFEEAGIKIFVGKRYNIT